MNSAFAITFLHANGYPAGVYRQFLDVLKARADVSAPEILETAPDCSPRLRWPTMLERAQQSMRGGGHGSGKRHVVVGHSMGGYIALQATAKHAELITHVVLIDSPIPTGWRSKVLSFSQATGLAYRAGPAPIAARRRDTWPSREAAREFFADKAFVKRWAPGVLDDFIEHAIVDAGQGVTLRVPRDTERDIYAHVAHRPALNALRSLQMRGISINFIAGEHSEETRMAGAEANARLFAPNFHVMPYGHLIPMEAPQACAEMVLKVLSAP
jgi:pimeloyl-ACP methyl ester carboxylesterase